MTQQVCQNETLTLMTQQTRQERGKDEFTSYDAAACGRYDYDSYDFFADAVVCPSLRASDIFWQNVQKSAAAGSYQNLYFLDAGNASYATASGSIFWPVLHIWH